MLTNKRLTNETGTTAGVQLLDGARLPDPGRHSIPRHAALGGAAGQAAAQDAAARVHRSRGPRRLRRLQTPMCAGAD